MRHTSSYIHKQLSIRQMALRDMIQPALCCQPGSLRVLTSSFSWMHRTCSRSKALFSSSASWFVTMPHRTQIMAYLPIYIGLILMVNVGKNTVHECYACGWPFFSSNTKNLPPKQKFCGFFSMGNIILVWQATLWTRDKSSRWLFRRLSICAWQACEQPV